MKVQSISVESKSHLNGLNEVLKHLQQNAKNLKNSELLHSLKQHVNCIFDVYLSELTQIKQQQPEVEEKRGEASIKMKPLVLDAPD